MALAAGRLRHSVILQSPSYAQDPVTGENVLTWVDRGTVRAGIEPLSVREFIAAQAAQSETSVNLIIRHNGEIDATWRAVHFVRGTIYNIHGVQGDKESGLEYQILPCSTGVNDGR